MTEAATTHSETERDQPAETPSTAPPSRVQTSPAVETLAKGFDARIVEQVRQFYVRPDASGKRDGVREPLFKTTEKFLSSSDDSRCLLVLAGPGEGKTSYVLNYLAWHQDKRRTPILAVALGHPKAAEYVATVGETDRKQCLLLLDGLDEYPSSSGDSEQRLDKVLQIARGFKRVVVTAREHLFPAPTPSEGEEISADAGPAWALTSFLFPLNEKQVSRYLKQRYSFWKIGRRRAARRLIQGVPAVSKVALLLAHSDELLAAKNVRGVADALEAMIEAWLFREKNVLERDALLGFAKRLALLAYKKTCQGRRARVTADEARALAEELGHAVPELGPHRPLLLSDEDGSLGFVHTAILEYLFTCQFLELPPDARKQWLGADEPRWTPLVTGMALERYVGAGADLSYSDLRGVELSGVDLSQARLVGARLARANLKSARLAGADASAADLARTLLTSADLHGIDLSAANLAGADLSEADLADAKFDGADLRGAVLSEVTSRGASLDTAKLDAQALRTLGPPELRFEGEIAIEPVTQMRFVWIPGGSFKMGHDGDPPESSPAHQVRLSSFWLGETAVTNRQYGIFLQQTGHPKPEFWDDVRFSDPQQPAVGVRFEDALAFCRWLEQTSGLQVGLPTEAEWEYAARGTDGRRYPWGNEPPTAQRACYEEDAMDGRPAKVGTHAQGRGPHGALDQAGNVWEWCLDTWDPMAYLKRSRELALDPVVEDGQAGVQLVRGGSWFFPPEDLDATARGKNQADKSADDLGFRVALRRTPVNAASGDSDLMNLSLPPT